MMHPGYAYALGVVAFGLLTLAFAPEATIVRGHIPRSHRRTRRARKRVARFRRRGYGFMTGVLRWIRPLAFSSGIISAIIGIDWLFTRLLLK